MSRVGGGGRSSPLSKEGGGGSVAPLPSFPTPMIHRPTYIHLYVHTLLSVSVILLHFPITLNLQIHMHACFLCVLTFLPQSPQSVPPTKRPHPHRFSQQSEPFGVSARGLSQPKFGQQNEDGASVPAETSDVIMTLVSYFCSLPCVPRKARKYL